MASAPLDLHPNDVELQQEGQQAAEAAPAPLQNATRDLGVQYKAADVDPKVQSNQYRAVAGVPENDPHTIDIADPSAMKQAVPHELYHTWANNLPPSLKARIPQSTGTQDYGEPTAENVNAMRAKGMTLLDVPNERAAEMMRWASNHPHDPKVQAAMKPWLDDMRKTPLSTIEGTAPTDKEINTHPRTPMGPRDDQPGMEGFNAEKHFVKPGGGKPLSAEDAVHYLKAAKGNKDIARAMARHDNHKL